MDYWVIWYNCMWYSTQYKLRNTWQEREMFSWAPNHRRKHLGKPPLRGHLTWQQQVAQTLLEQKRQWWSSASLWHLEVSELNEKKTLDALILWYGYNLTDLWAPVYSCEWRNPELKIAFGRIFLMRNSSCCFPKAIHTVGVPCFFSYLLLSYLLFVFYSQVLCLTDQIQRQGQYTEDYWNRG